MRLRFAIVATALLSSSVVHAEREDAAMATELFNVGRDLMKKGQFAAACPKLAESVRLHQTVGALAKLADCEEHEKRLVEARARWQQAINLARTQNDSRLASAQAQFTRLDKIVPKLSFTCNGDHNITVKVDETELSS